MYSYFGEVTMWAAHFAAAQSTLSSPLISGRLFPVWMAYATVASPLLEYGLIRFVSGVPILEVRSRFRSRALEHCEVGN